MRIIAVINHHLVLKMFDVLDRFAHSRVAVEGQSPEFLRKLTLQDLFEEGGVREFDI